MASFGRTVDVGEYAPVFRNFAQERLALMKAAGLQKHSEPLNIQTLPGSSRMILGGQLGEFHDQIFEPTGPLLAPTRTLGSAVSLFPGFSKHQVDQRTRDFSTGGDRWHGPQDESRLKAIRSGMNTQGEFWRVTGTQSHPTNSLFVLPETKPSFDDLNGMAGYLRMETGNWDSTTAHPNNSLRADQYNIGTLMHDRMIAKANMTSETLNTEGPSKLFTRFKEQGGLPSTRAPGLERPQTDAAIDLNIFGVRRQIPWPHPGVNTYTPGGHILASSVQSKFPVLAKEEGPPKPYDHEYHRLESRGPPPDLPVPSVRDKADGRPWEQEYIRKRMGVSYQYGRAERSDMYRPYGAYLKAMSKKRKRMLFGLPRPQNPFAPYAPVPAPAPGPAPPPVPGAVPGPGGAPAPYGRPPPVNNLPAITPSGAKGPAFAPQNQLYAKPQIPTAPGHSGSGKPLEGTGPPAPPAVFETRVGVGAHTQSDPERAADQRKEQSLTGLHPAYSVKFSTGEPTDAARMKEPDDDEDKPEQVSKTMGSVYARAQSEALASGMPLVSESSSIAGNNAAGSARQVGGAQPSLEDKVNKLLEAQEQKAARRAAKKARSLPAEAETGAKRLVSFLK